VLKRRRFWRRELGVFSPDWRKDVGNESPKDTCDMKPPEGLRIGWSEWLDCPTRGVQLGDAAIQSGSDLCSRLTSHVVPPVASGISRASRP